MSDFNKLAEAVFAGNLKGAGEITQSLIDAGAVPMEIVNKGLIGGMDLVAPKFKNGEMFVPEVMRSAKALSIGMDLVKPLLASGDVSNAGTIIIGTVSGDLHDIGKNLVKLILESGNFNVIDLGVDISPAQFIEAIKEHKPQIVGLSALLTSTMMMMKETIDAIGAAGLRNEVKILVGGAPITQEFADEIGADGYCADAVVAKEVVSDLIVKKV